MFRSVGRLFGLGKKKSRLKLKRKWRGVPLDFEILEARRVMSSPATFVSASWSTNHPGDMVSNPDGGTLVVGTDAFATIQGGVNGVSSGGIVTVFAGTYTENVTINQPLTLLGAQAGVNAATRSGNESVVMANNGVTQFSIAANDVTIDGFTIEDETSGNVSGAAVFMEPGTSGTHIVNDIIEDNLTGIFVANGSAADQTVIEQDLFQDNTQPGVNSGNDIYADEFTTGGGLQNVLIANNTFTNSTFQDDGTAFDISNTGTSSFTNLTFSGNVVTNHGVGALFFGTTDALITGNTITGADFDAIALLGSDGTPANASFTITNNKFDEAGSGGAGVGLFDDSPGTAYSGTLTLSGNQYTTTNHDQSIDNESTTPINATGDTFNGVLASAATPTQQLAIAATIIDGINFSGSGLVQTSTASDLFVPAGGSIQSAVDFASSGDTIYVAAGTFDENVIIDKPLTLLGAEAGTAGGDPTRDGGGSESDVVTSGNQVAVFQITSSNVTIDGFKIDGEASPSVAGVLLSSGEIANVAYGILADGLTMTNGIVPLALSNIDVTDDIVTHAEIGFRGDGPGSGTATSGNKISANWFDSIGIYDFGYAVNLRTNFYADVTGNLMTRVQSGLQTNNFYLADPDGTWLFQNNTVAAYGAGVWQNLTYNAATPLTIDGNTLSADLAPSSLASSIAGYSSFTGLATGILVVSLQSAVPLIVTNNTIQNMPYGVILFSDSTTGPLAIGSTNAISASAVGVDVTNEVGFNPVTTTVLGGAANNPNAVTSATLSGLTIDLTTSTAVGVLVQDDNTNVTYGSVLTLTGNNVLSGGGIGVEVTGAHASLAGNTLGTATFTGQASDYVVLSNSAYDGPLAIDGTAATYDGTPGGATLTPTAAYSIEDKISDYLDANTPASASVGFVRLADDEIYVTQLSDSIQRGINAASSGDTVNVGPGTFVENDVVNKPLTLSGAEAGTAGGDPTRDAGGSESDVVTSGNQVAVFQITSSNVTIDGFKIDGEAAPSVAGVLLSSGEIANVAYGILADGLTMSNGIVPLALSNIDITDDIVTHAEIGFRGDGPASGTATSGNKISANWFDSIGVYDFGYAVNLRTNFYADVTGNLMTRVQSGLQSNNFYLIDPDGTWLFQNNTVAAYGAGVWQNLTRLVAAPLTIDGNTFSADLAPSSLAGSIAGYSSFTGLATGILVVSLLDGVPLAVTNNTIQNMPYGVILFGDSTTGSATIGSTNAITASKVGVDVTDEVGFDPVGTTVLGGSANNPSGVTHVTLSAMTIDLTTSSAVGVLVQDDNTNVTFGSVLTLSGNNTLSGGGIGLEVTGPHASLAGNTLGSTTFTGQASDYVVLSNSACDGPVAVDGTAAMYDGTAGGATLTPTAASPIEDKISDYLDVNTPGSASVGFVRLRSGQIYVTQLSDSIQRGIDAASSSDTVHVNDGTYIGSNLDVDKSVTIVGQDRAGVIVAPSLADSHDDSEFGGADVSNAFVVQSSGVTIEDLTVDGNANSLLAGAQNFRAGVVTDYNFGAGVFDDTVVDSVSFKNIYRNGVELISIAGGDPATAVSTGNLVENSSFDSIATDYTLNPDMFGFAVFFGQSSGSVTGNTITNAGNGIGTNFITQFPSYAPTVTISGNNLSQFAVVPGFGSVGLVLAGLALDSQVTNNVIDTTGDGQLDYAVQLSFLSDVRGTALAFTGNTITTKDDDVGILVSRRSFGVSSSFTPVALSDNTLTHTGAAGGVGIQITNDFGGPSSHDNAAATLTGNTVAGYVTGIDVDSNSETGNPTDPGDPVSVTFGLGNAITGGTTGLVLDGKDVAVVGNTLSNLAVSGQSGDYITLADDALVGQELNATAVTFGSVVGNSVTVPQGLAIEDKITDALDNAALGFVRIQTGNVFVTQMSDSIQRGINVAHSGDTVYVGPGTFVENDVVNKPLTLSGAEAGTAGGDPTRDAGGSESDVVTSGNQVAVFQITSSNVTIEGFKIDGEANPSVAGVLLSSGDIANVAYGILADGLTMSNGIIALALSHIDVTDNIVTHAEIGFRGDGPASGTATSGNKISANWFDSIGVYDFGYAVNLRTNFYADVTGNLMTRVQSGLQSNVFDLADPDGAWLFQNNTVAAYGAGVWQNLTFSNGTPLTIDGNTFSADLAPSSLAGSIAGYSSFTGLATGIMVVSLENAIPLIVTNNSIQNMPYGVILFNTTSNGSITIDGTNDISASKVGIDVTDEVGFNPVTTTILGGAANNPNGVTHATLSGVTIDLTTSTAVGVLVQDDNTIVTFGSVVSLSGNNVLSGGGTGLEVAGPHASLAGNTLGSTTFTGQTSDYVALANSAYGGPLAIDGTAATYDGTPGGATLSVPAAFAIEDKISDYLDANTPASASVGFVRLASGQIYVTQLSDSIQRGINAASSGDTVNVAAGTFVENDVVNKPLTLSGAEAGTAGGDPTRDGGGSESDVVTSGNQVAVFQITSSNVTIDGFKIDGEASPSVAGVLLSSGEIANVAYGILADGLTMTNGIVPLALSNIDVTDDIVTHAEIGFRGDGPGSGTATSGNKISANWFDSIGIYDFGYAVNLRTNFYADVTGNLMTRVQSGLQTNNFYLADPDGTWLFQNNTVAAYGAGVWQNLTYNAATPLTIDGNTLSADLAPSSLAGSIAGYSSFTGLATGILVVSLQSAVPLIVTNNTIQNMPYGVILFGDPTTGLAIGGTNSISASKVGIDVTNEVGFNPVGTTVLGGAANNPNAVTNATLTGVTINLTTSSAVGVLVQDDNTVVTFGSVLTLSGNNVLSGGGIGVEVTVCPHASSCRQLARLDHLHRPDVQLRRAVELWLPTARIAIDGTAATYDGTPGGSHADADRPGIFDRRQDRRLPRQRIVQHPRLRDQRGGFVFVSPMTSIYVTQLSDSQSADRGINAASSGDTVNVGPGTFVETPPTTSAACSSTSR